MRWRANASANFKGGPIFLCRQNYKLTFTCFGFVFEFDNPPVEESLPTVKAVLGSQKYRLCGRMALMFCVLLFSTRYANRELGVEFRQVSKVRLVPVLAAPRALDDGEAREEAR